MTKIVDLEKSVLDYITEIKPYHTKVLNVALQYNAFDTVGVGTDKDLTTAFTESLNFDIEITNPGFYNILGDISTQGWDQLLWDDFTWDYEFDLSFLPITVVDINITDNYFELVGDYTDKFKYGYQFLLTQSFQNNKNWYVLKSIYDISVNKTKIYTLHDILYPKLPLSPNAGVITNVVPRAYANTGFDVEKTVRVKSDTTLPVYTKFGSGVGATIVANNNGVLPPIDGISLAVGDRFLFTHGQTDKDNGIWIVTDKGTASTPFQLIRAADADQHIPSELTNGLFVFISQGYNFAESAWALSTPNPIVVDTTDLIFTPVTVSNLFRLPRNNYEIRVVIGETLEILDDMELNLVEQHGTIQSTTLWDLPEWDAAPWDAQYDIFSQIQDDLVFDWTDADTFSLPIIDVRQFSQYMIDSINVSPSNSILIDGDVTSIFVSDRAFEIIDTFAINSRIFIVLSSTFNGTHTEIFVNGDLYDPSIQGFGPGTAIIGNEIAVTGNKYIDFPKGYDVLINSSTGNDGFYKVDFSYYDGIKTYIRFEELLPSIIIDGNVER